MKRESEEERRVSGRDSSLHDQGAVYEDVQTSDQKRQSCHGSLQIRIRISETRAEALLKLTPSTRAHLIGLLLNEGVDFTRAAALVTELRELRLAMINTLRQAQFTEAAVDAGLLEGAIKRVTELLGGSR